MCSEGKSIGYPAAAPLEKLRKSPDINFCESEIKEKDLKEMTKMDEFRAAIRKLSLPFNLLQAIDLMDG